MKLPGLAAVFPVVSSEQRERKGAEPQHELAVPVPALAIVKPAGFWAIVGWVLVAVVALHTAYQWRATSFLVVGYVFALVQMARASTWRLALYGGLVVGLLISFLRLDFFWGIFSGGAAALWIVFSIWIGLFVALSRSVLKLDEPENQSLGLRWVVIPFIWCGLEYFRSELYYLRFSWLSPGLAFGEGPEFVSFSTLGTYGLGFVAACVACGASMLWGSSKWKSVAVLLAGAGILRLWAALPETPASAGSSKPIRVVGVQMEFPNEGEVLLRLNEVDRRYPDADLIVLSEYTFGEPVPEKVRAWCRQHGRYLVVGGKDPISKGRFYNTAFVISPEGEIVFRQVKSVPIQFFNDGLPAPEQKIWDSPWGRIGICICYDLSYSRVTDRLVMLGAEALLVPTMDMIDWGLRQHLLHARIAPVRAAEYGIPIFRVASSGVSQLVNNNGRVLASAPCPGEGVMIAGNLELGSQGSLPLDRWLAPFSVIVTVGVALASVGRAIRRRRDGCAAEKAVA